MNGVPLLLFALAGSALSSATLSAPPLAFTGKDLARSAAVYERALQEGHFRNEAEERDVNYYLGYVEGAAFASPKLCLPPSRGVRDQLGAATASYLRLHPREWHLAPDALVLKAVLPLFGCSKAPAPKAHKR
jgi:hypothetical protein